jgi:thiol-disulfide isomerase/thioredoxin
MRPMTRKSFTITLSILAVLFIIQHIYVKQPDILKQVSASDKYSDIEINLLGGSFEPIGYYKDKEPVVLVFWASNSNPSKLFLTELTPKLNNWHAKDSFTLIAVNVGDSKPVIEKTKELWGLNMKIGLDPDKKIAKDFGVGALPTVIFINKAGKIKKRWDNFGEDLTNQLRYRISAENKTKEDVDLSDIDTSKAKIDTIIEDGDTTIRIRTKH